MHAYLGSVDTPIAAERWRALGPAAAPVLAEVVDDAAALPTRRARALAALGVVDVPSAAARVRQLVGDASAPLVLRSSAMRAAPVVLGSPEGVALVRSQLVAEDAGVRERAARALGASGAPGCRALAEARRLRSGDAALRTAGDGCAPDGQDGGRPPVPRPSRRR